jgi:hypothetical protein
MRSVTNKELAFAAVDLHHPRVDTARWTMSRAMLSEIEGYRATWQARMPALFGRGFVSLDRSLRGA